MLDRPDSDRWPIRPWRLRDWVAASVCLTVVFLAIVGFSLAVFLSLGEHAYYALKGR